MDVQQIAAAMRDLPLAQRCAGILLGTLTGAVVDARARFRPSLSREALWP